MKKINLLFLFLISIVFLNGCSYDKIINGSSDREMLKSLQNKYGISFDIVKSDREVRYAGGLQYYYREWIMTPQNHAEIKFLVVDEYNENSRSFYLTDDYTQQLFNYYLSKADIDYSIVEQSDYAMSYVYYEDESQIKDVIRRTCAVIQQVLKDESYKHMSDDNRDIVMNLTFALKGYDNEFECPGFFTSHGIIIPSGAIADISTPYTVVRQNYNSVSKKYDQEIDRKQMSIYDLPDLWLEQTKEEYKRYNHDIPFVIEAHDVALKNTNNQYSFKELSLSNVTWSKNWNNDTIYFLGFDKNEKTYKTIQVESNNGKWKVEEFKKIEEK